MDKFPVNNNNNSNNYNQDYSQSYNPGQQWNEPLKENKPEFNKNKTVIATALGTLAAVALAGSIYAISTSGSDDNQKANSDKQYENGLTIEMIRKRSRADELEAKGEYSAHAAGRAIQEWMQEQGYLDERDRFYTYYDTYGPNDENLAFNIKDTTDDNIKYLMEFSIVGDEITELSYAKCDNNNYCGGPDDPAAKFSDVEAIPTREQSWKIVRNIPNKK